MAKKKGEKRDIKKLIVQLKDKNKNVRESAAKALCAIGTLAVPALLKAMQDADKKAYERLVTVLDRIEDKSTVPDLIGILLKNKIGGLRIFAAEALGNTGDKRAVPALIEALKNEDGEVRKAAKEALKKIKSKQKK